MKREYTIVIEATPAHQPSTGEIFTEVSRLVENRTKQFPKTKGGTHVTIIPHPTEEIERLRAIPSPPRQPHRRK